MLEFDIVFEFDIIFDLFAFALFVLVADPPQAKVKAIRDKMATESISLVFIYLLILAI